MTAPNRAGRSSSRNRRREALTTGDRLVCAACGAIMGLIAWTILYAILFLAAVIFQSRPDVAARVAAGLAPATPWDVAPSFWWWGGLIAAVFSLFGFLAGPERMMDTFEKVVHHEFDLGGDFISDVSQPD